MRSSESGGHTQRERVSETFRDSRQFAKASEKYNWIEYFGLQQRMQSTVNTFVLPEPLNSLQFVISPFAVQHSPIIANVSGDMYECHGCAPAAKSVKKAMCEFTQEAQIRELTGRRQVWKGYVTDKAKADEYVKRHNELNPDQKVIIKLDKKTQKSCEYILLRGFSSLDLETPGYDNYESISAGETEYSDESGTAYVDLLSRIIEIGQRSVREVCWHVCARNMTELADDFGVSTDKLCRGERILGLLMYTMLFPTTDAEWPVSEHDVFEHMVRIGSSRSVTPDDCAIFLSLCCWLPPVLHMDMQHATGCPTCMPNESGWGFLSPVSASNEKALVARGVGKLSLGEMFEFSMHNICADVEEGHNPFARGQLLNTLSALDGDETSHADALAAFVAFKNALHSQMYNDFHVDIYKLFVHSKVPYAYDDADAERVAQTNEYDSVRRRLTSMLEEDKARREMMYIEKKQRQNEALARDNPHYSGNKGAIFQMRLSARANKYI